MQAVRTWLLQAYPYAGPHRTFLRNAWLGGLFVTLFLFIFQPFGTNYSRHELWDFLLICSYFGLATVIGCVLMYTIALGFSSFFKEDDWVIWKEIVANLGLIMIIGVLNLLLASVLYKRALSWHSFWIFQMYTLLIGLFPIVITAFTKQRMLLQRYRTAAQTVSDGLHLGEEQISGVVLQLQGENQQDEISLAKQHLLYMEAADNYVKVVSYDGQQAQQAMLRSSLKAIEEQLQSYPRIYRCHRTYMVNLDLVEQVSGNAQGYKLHLPYTEKLIPVSRSLNKEIGDLLN